MSDQCRPYLRHGPTVVSLVAALTCAFASNASASRSSVPARVDNDQLAARVAAWSSDSSQRTDAPSRPVARREGRAVEKPVGLGHGPAQRH